MSYAHARYDAYKDSGVEWLGEVPAHWGISHLKRLSQKITDGAHTSPDLSSNDYPFLTVVNLNNRRLDFENCLFTSHIDYEKLVRNGCQPKKHDVLYSKDGTISEAVVIDEDRNFVVGSSFIIVRPHLKTNNPDYLCHLLSSAIMRYQARVYVKGASLPRISIFNIAKLIAISPPLPEQTAIAVYLDTKTAQIDRKIDLFSQKAAQYGKLKQSLINETVTRGLDKTVQMKDSGVEWIGRVPEHWEVKRPKGFVYFKKGKTPKLLSDDSQFLPYLSMEFLRGKDKQTNYVPPQENLMMVVENEFLVLWDGANAGEIMVAKNGYLSSTMAVIKLKKTLFNNAFFFYFLKALEKQFKDLSNGTTIPHFAPDILINESFGIPPMMEQQAIANYLDEKTAHIDRIVVTINTQIDKLKELRKALINDIVTGKICVFKQEYTHE